MSNIKISQLPSAGALSGSEILPIVQAGDTKSTSINSIIGQVGLQQVLDNNNTANQNILLDDGSGNISAISPLAVITSNGGDQIWLNPTNIRFDKGSPNSTSLLKTTNVTSDRNWEFPNASGTLALLSDIPSSSGWGLTGNSGTNPGTNFIGTTDNKDLVLKRNNVEYLKLDQYYGLVTNKNILCQDEYPDIKAASYIASNRSVSLNFDSSISATAGHIQFSNNGIIGYLLADNISGSNKNIQLPNASGTLAVSTTVGYSGSKTIGGQVYTWENGILITVV
jgi:hypothetical protein